jgi:hypothetical protein
MVDGARQVVRVVHEEEQREGGKGGVRGGEAADRTGWGLHKRDERGGEVG